MNWKDDLKQILIGAPLLWLFMIGAGFILYYVEKHYWIWILLVLLIPIIVTVIRSIQKEKD